MTTLTPQIPIGEVRDRIAAILKFSIECQGIGGSGRPATCFWVKRDGANRITKMLDPLSLDTIAALWPDYPGDLTISKENFQGPGTNWHVRWMEACGGHTQFKKPISADGETELEARTRLLLHILEAEKSK